MKKINYQNYMKIEVPSIMPNLEIVCSTVVNFAMQLNFTHWDVKEINIAIYEAVHNCILHAYKNNPGIITIITTIINDNIFDVVIKDRGVGIVDIEKATQPLYTTADEESECCGMGFTVMDAFMTKCKVKSVPGKGTTVHMQKHIG